MTYNQTRNYKGAALYEKKYIQLDDSTHQGQLNKIVKIQSDFEERENMKTIASQKQILLLKEDAINNHRLLILLVGVVAVLLVGLSIILSRMNREKQRINFLLDKRVRLRTQSLEESLVELQRSHTEQSQFLSNTSSDLRAPLMSLKGLLHIMSADIKGSQTTQDDLVRLEDTAENLSSIVNRLADNNRRA